MAYIGNQPSESFTSFATQEFSTSATTSYTLDHAVTNENEIALFINNVRQQPGSGKAYTATGTTLTLSAATASTDTMYCVFLGRALQTVTPATNSITAAMVGNDLISGKTALASEPADTDEFLVSDAGTLKRIDYSLIKGSGKVLQVVQGTHGTEDNFGNTSFQATETDVDITPSATSSKVLVTVHIPFVIITANEEFVFTIYRDSTNLALTAVRGFCTMRAKDSDYYAGVFSASFLDSPSSTSQLHYEAYVKRDTGSGNIYLNYNTAATSSITAIEIGA